MSYTAQIIVGCIIVILFNLFYHLGKWIGYRQGALDEKKSQPTQRNRYE